MNLRGLLIVSSCYARQCHPETCCCDDDEFAVQGWKKDSAGYSYYGTILYGTREECQQFIDVQQHSETL